MEEGTVAVQPEPTFRDRVNAARARLIEAKGKRPPTTEFITDSEPEKKPQKSRPRKAQPSVPEIEAQSALYILDWLDNEQNIEEMEKGPREAFLCLHNLFECMYVKYKELMRSAELRLTTMFDILHNEIVIKRSTSLVMSDLESGLRQGDLFLSRGEIKAFKFHSRHMDGISTLDLFEHGRKLKRTAKEISEYIAANYSIHYGEATDKDFFHICNAIVDSGVYADNSHFNWGFIYSGEGMKGDQKMSNGNSGLVHSFVGKKTVRVFRKQEGAHMAFKERPFTVTTTRQGKAVQKVKKYLPQRLYEYAGEYLVAAAWFGTSSATSANDKKSETNIWRFKMVSLNTPTAPPDRPYLKFDVYTTHGGATLPAKVTKAELNLLAVLSVDFCSDIPSLIRHIRDSLPGKVDDLQPYLMMKGVQSGDYYFTVEFESSISFPIDMIFCSDCCVAFAARDPTSLMKDIARGSDQFTVTVNPDIPADYLDKILHFGYCANNILFNTTVDVELTKGTPIGVPMELSYINDIVGVGARSVHSIAAGSYICSYVGIMIDDDSAYLIGLLKPQEYLFSLRSDTAGNEVCVLDQGSIGNVCRWFNHAPLHLQNVIAIKVPSELPEVDLYECFLYVRESFDDFGKRMTTKGRTLVVDLLKARFALLSFTTPSRVKASKNPIAFLEDLFGGVVGARVVVVRYGETVIDVVVEDAVATKASAAITEAIEKSNAAFKSNVVVTRLTEEASSPAKRRKKAPQSAEKPSGSAKDKYCEYRFFSLKDIQPRQYFNWDYGESYWAERKINPMFIDADGVLQIPNPPVVQPPDVEAAPAPATTSQDTPMVPLGTD